MPITKHEAAQLRGYISHHMQAVKAQQHGCSIGLTQDELRTRAESARSDLYKFILGLVEQNSVEPIKASPKFLDMALSCGAELTGKPDGSEPITVVFTCEAWRAFDGAVSADLVAQYQAGYKKVEEGAYKAVIEDARLLAERLEKSEARVAQLERFADSHPDTKLLDFLTSRASINFDDENCLLRFEVPSAFEGANNLRDIVRTAMENSDG